MTSPLGAYFLFDGTSRQRTVVGKGYPDQAANGKPVAMQIGCALRLNWQSICSKLDHSREDSPRIRVQAAAGRSVWSEAAATEAGNLFRVCR
jgi:hypothetical protein